jgi:dinuclear metal center YbgI/SA1388 family protein
MISLHALIEILDDWMHPGDFSDYAPNGLQIEGRATVRKLALGVTASAEVIDGAVQWGADALLVHHGYFWRNEPQVLIGMKGARVKKLFANNLSLLAYHLPLDCHVDFGNNRALLDELRYADCQPVEGEKGLLWMAMLNPPETLEMVGKRVAMVLQREPLLVSSPRGSECIEKLIVCTGGAQDYLGRAAALGADAYLSGEISERTTHEARELGVHYIAAGHHATERFGIQALGQKLSSELRLEVAFFDDFNPA